MSDVIKEESVQDAEQNGQHAIDTESMTLPELLDHRYSLPAEDRRSISPNKAIAGSTKKMMIWAFHCAYQDRPVLVILAGSILLYHGIKFAVDMLKGWI